MSAEMRDVYKPPPADPGTPPTGPVPEPIPCVDAKAREGVEPVQTMMNWWQSKNASHALATVLGLFVAAYLGYPPFHDLVMSLYKQLPGAVETLIGAAIFLILAYKPNLLTPPPAAPKTSE